MQKYKMQTKYEIRIQNLEIELGGGLSRRWDDAKYQMQNTNKYKIGTQIQKYKISAQIRKYEYKIQKYTIETPCCQKQSQGVEDCLALSERKTKNLIKIKNTKIQNQIRKQRENMMMGQAGLSAGLKQLRFCLFFCSAIHPTPSIHISASPLIVMI